MATTPVFEVVGSLYRTPVPGGWLVAQGIGGGPLIYVPDPNGDWLKAAPPVIVPPAPAPVVFTRSHIGTNLGPQVDWATDFPYVNHVQRAQAPFSGAHWGAWNDGRALNLDARGNVLSLQAGQVARHVIFSAARPAGDYIVSWQGKGSVEVQGATVKDASVPNQITVTVPSTGTVDLDIVAVDATTPLHDLRMVRADQAALTGLFNPDFIAEMRRYSTIRFMDWQGTNFSRTAASLAGDFAPLSALPVAFGNAFQGQSNGTSVPLEVMIELCNETGCDGWFCVPIQADYTWRQNFYARVRAKLAPGLKCYVENSNEVWNGSFPQSKFYSTTDFATNMNGHADASAVIAKEVAVGLPGVGVSVLGSWAAVSFWSDQMLARMQKEGALPNAIAIAPYFGSGAPDNVAGFADGTIAAQVTQAVGWAKATKAVADKYAVPVVCYEGGMSQIPGTAVAADPRMGDTYASYLEQIRVALGDTVFNHYNFCSQWGTSGAWGEKPYQYGPPTPKSQAIAAAIQAHLSRA